MTAPRPRVAGADIGANSVRLLLCEGRDADGPAGERRSTVTGLRRGAGADGALAEDALGRLDDCLAGYGAAAAAFASAAALAWAFGSTAAGGATRGAADRPGSGQPAQGRTAGRVLVVGPYRRTRHGSADLASSNDAIRDPQIRVYVCYTLAFALIVTIYLRATRDISFFDALTHATFSMISVITTTGFATDDYLLWGPFPVACIYVATFLGGCSGSTTGGIKAYRFLILFQLMGNGVRRLIYPNMVQPVRYGDRTIDQDMQRAVVLFISSFFVLWAIITMLLGATGIDFLSASTGALASLTNVGPGLSPQIGPMGNYADIPAVAKWICSAAMLLGRLEILSVLVIFSPVFWRA